MIQRGDTIGQWKVIRHLGKGGMGSVYEVEHCQLGGRRALKIFSLKDGEIGVLRRKFYAEAKILYALKHRSLVRVCDLVAEDPKTGLPPYFVMDLVADDSGESTSLGDLKRKGDITSEQIKVWYSDLVGVLTYLHSKGVIHRDIKPSNVMVGDDGHAVLLDFGVASIEDDRLRAELFVERTFVTGQQTGDRIRMGTMEYWAPEVLRGKSATAASDLWALGSLVWYLLLGHPYDPSEDDFAELDICDESDYWRDILTPILNPIPEKRKFASTAVRPEKGVTLPKMQFWEWLVVIPSLPWSLVYVWGKHKSWWRFCKVVMFLLVATWSLVAFALFLAMLGDDNTLTGEQTDLKPAEIRQNAESMDDRSSLSVWITSDEWERWKAERDRKRAVTR